jgi:hypothetical protein
MEGLENIKFLFAPSHKFVKSNNGVLILQGIWRFDFSNKNIEGDLEWYVCSNKFKDGCDATATVAVAREETEFEEVKHLVNWPEKPFRRILMLAFLIIHIRKNLRPIKKTNQFLL